MRDVFIACDCSGCGECVFVEISGARGNRDDRVGERREVLIFCPACRETTHLVIGHDPPFSPGAPFPAGSRPSQALRPRA